MMQSPVPAEMISQRRILQFWLPLASSWLLMTAEMPLINAAIARLPDGETMIAAFGITASLSITIESPVIMLLASATALATHRQAYAVLRRFTIHLMILTTVITLLFGYTPLYDVVVRTWMGIPQAIADAALPGLRVMTLWSAAIGWRRFKQGVMIRYGYTRMVGVGTGIRLIASAGTALGLAAFFSHEVSGVVVGGFALMAGVVAEAIYAHWAAAPIIALHLPAHPPDQSDLTYRSLLSFHMPLAAVSLLTLMAQPFIGAALARAAMPERSLAAWPVVGGLVSIFRSTSYALPEVVIALNRSSLAAQALRRFCLGVGLVTTGLLTLLAATPGARFYLGTLIGISDELIAIALPGIWLAVAIPLINSTQSYLRGTLMGWRATAAIYLAMVIHLLTLGGTLAVGAWQGIPGVPLATAALTLALTTEGLFLGWQVRRGASRLIIFGNDGFGSFS